MQIRTYRAGDLDACRALYAELVQHHREIYDDPSIGGDDPGAGFDEYFARADRVASWVAVDNEGVVVGLSGLLWSEGESIIEPVIVTADRRHEGVGRQLIETAIDESRQRGATDVSIRPVARNDSAIRAFHDLGFTTLGHVQMFMTLDGDPDYWRDGIDLHDRRFTH